MKKLVTLRRSARERRLQWRADALIRQQDGPSRLRGLSHAARRRFLVDKFRGESASNYSRTFMLFLMGLFGMTAAAFREKKVRGSLPADRPRLRSFCCEVCWRTELDIIRADIERKARLLRDRAEASDPPRRYGRGGW